MTLFSEGNPIGMGLQKIPTDIVTEPWMKDFVKGRHTQEEWEAFMVYCQAGPWKRLGIWMAIAFNSWWIR